MISKTNVLPTAKVLPRIGYSLTPHSKLVLIPVKLAPCFGPNFEGHASVPCNHAYVFQSSRWHPEMMLSASGGFFHVRDPAWHAEFAAADIGEYGDALANLRVGRIAETHA